jgi:hypothetical protein
MRPGHLVCGFVGISRRDEPRVLLLATATTAKLNLVNVHDTHVLAQKVYRQDRKKAVTPITISSSQSSAR